MTEEMAFSMAEGEMDVEVVPGGVHTKGFRLYSLILLAMLSLGVAVVMKSPEIAVLSNVVTFLLGVFTGKKA